MLYLVLTLGGTSSSSRVTLPRLPIHPMGWVPVFSHFAEEETEAQRDSVKWLGRGVAGIDTRLGVWLLNLLEATK